MANPIRVNSLILLALTTVRAKNQFDVNDATFQEQAIFLLNEVLASMNSTAGAIPFWETVSFSLTPGKRTYSVGNSPSVDVLTSPFVQMDYITIILNNIQYPVSIQNDLAFFGQMVYLQNQARPEWVRINRQEDLSTIEFLPSPDQIYQCEIRGKKALPLVDFQQIIDLPVWYGAYIRLFLAKKLNSFYNLAAWDDNLESQLLAEETLMYASSKKDWSIQSESPLKNSPIQVAWNIGVIT